MTENRIRTTGQNRRQPPSMSRDVPMTNCVDPMRHWMQPARRHTMFDGSLTQPKDWETWVMVGSSTGLSYAAPGAAPAAGAAPGMFHNVYIQPWAYRELPRYRSGPRQCVHAVLSIHA